MSARWFVPVLVAIACVSACRKAPPPPPPTQVEVVAVAELPAAPDDPAWQTAPEYVAKLVVQDLVEPRLMEASTPEVRVRALSDGRDVAFRLEWPDATDDNLPRPAMFGDACAVQVPAQAGASVPAPQMGEPGRPVEILLWNAPWQAVVDGRGDDIRAIYPNAAVDHYPFQAAALEPGSAAEREMAARYAPARALGNAMAGPRTTPVQELGAEGPGTLAPRSFGGAGGRGKRTADGWSVLLRRPLPDGLASAGATQVAFAVWEGSHQEVGARKMRTAWIPLAAQ